MSGAVGAQPRQGKLHFGDGIAARQPEHRLYFVQTSHSLAALTVEVNMPVPVLQGTTPTPGEPHDAVYIHDPVHQSLIHQPVQYAIDRDPVAQPVQCCPYVNMGKRYLRFGYNAVYPQFGSSIPGRFHGSRVIHLQQSCINNG